MEKTILKEGAAIVRPVFLKQKTLKYTLPGNEKNVLIQRKRALFTDSHKVTLFFFFFEAKYLKSQLSDVSEIFVGNSLPTMFSVIETVTIYDKE